LRRVQLAYGASITAEWGSVVALSVFAYHERGATGVAIVGILRTVPAALATPFAAVAADRFRRERVLLAIELGAAAALAASAVAFYAGRAEIPIYALAAVLAIFATVLRPTLAALLPSLAASPAELIASNSASLTTESLGTLAGPLLAGVLVATVEPGAVFAAGAVLYLLGAWLVLSVRTERVDVAVAGRTGGSQLLGGFRVVAQEPQPRLLIALFGAQALVRGALNVLIVVMAFELLHEGGSWVGFLTAALGAGGLLGAFGSLTLAGRRLALPFGIGLLLWGIPIAALGLWPNKVAALVFLAAIGVGNSLEDVGGLTLLQRIVHDDALGRVLGVLWGLAMIAIGIGSVLAPPLIDGIGSRGAAVVTGIFLAVVVLAASPRLLAIDRVAAVPVEELAALDKVPMFHGLSVTAKERLASSLVPLTFGPGSVIVREGEMGDRFYIVVAGELDVAEGGRAAGRGSSDYFGEIALLRDVPRTATVTARTPVRLFALDRDRFLSAVSGYAAGRDAGDAIVAERLARA
jgi:MFS family permease